MKELIEKYDPITTYFPPLKAQQWHYKVHPYFTKQPGNVVAKYIEHYTRKGDIVLDPFCGSGVTAIEALRLGRKAIAVDLSPLATYITEQTCIGPIDVDEFQEAFNRLEKRVLPFIEKIRKASKEYIKEYKIKDWYPQGVSLPKNADCELVEDLFYRPQLIILAHILANIEKEEHKRYRELLKFAFSGILHRASKTYFKDSKDAGGGNSGIFTKFRYWVPKRPDKRDPWELFKIRFRIIRSAKNKWNDILGDRCIGKDLVVKTKSATQLSNYIEENSVDYIFTDPPYGAHIAYLDLSIMWHAWLKMRVTKKTFEDEIIEGGDYEHTIDHYKDLLTVSFLEMYKVLKLDKWLSLVYFHKDHKLWFTIIDAAKAAGFEYVNTVAQPLSKQTFHKIKNPLKVLGESLIVNFRKSRRVFPAIEREAVPAIKIIYNVAEREIYSKGGATSEDIMRAIVPELFEANLIDKVALTNMNDIFDLLVTEFDHGIDDRWHIKPEKMDKLGNYIPVKDRIKYYLISILRREKQLDLDKIVTIILPLLINGHEPTQKEILEILNEVAFSKDGSKWELKPGKPVVFQQELGFNNEVDYNVIPDLSAHNRTIYKLVMLGRRLRFYPYVGKMEYPEISEKLPKEVAILQGLPINNIDEVQRSRIEQIDCIWFFEGRIPEFAFEVEETTNFLTALERFYSLLERFPSIGTQRRLVIITPRSRKRKLTQELLKSSYAGHPMYMERKISYLYVEDLEAEYPKLVSDSEFSSNSIDRLLSPPETLEIR